MEQALIIINAEVNEKGQLISASPVTERMVTALQKGIAKYSPHTEEELTSVGSLWSKTGKRTERKSQITSPFKRCAGMGGLQQPASNCGKQNIKPEKSPLSSPNEVASSRERPSRQDEGYGDRWSNTIYCPLTIQLPEYFDFPAKKIYSACKDIAGRRRWVESKLGIKTSVGDSWLGHLWLPIILTKDQPIFGNIIGEGAIPNYYEQPIDFPLKKCKSLYNLASNLLESLSATPAVYLLQFSLYSNEIVFDRLWPFPAAPALASLRGSEIDLYSCHWLCLTGKSIPELEQVNPTMPIS